MIWLGAVVAVLLVVGSVLSMAEVAVTRTSRIRAMALVEEGRGNAAMLERIERDLPRYLNSIYLSLMFIQNGSAILVAFLAQIWLGSYWIAAVSVVFTVVYFLLVEAMSKTFAVLHSDRVALALARVVWLNATLLSLPTRLLIGMANVLLPGKGLVQGPFVSEEEIRSMADVGHQEGAIEEREREMIHSIFEFGDTVVREVMVPRPDMIYVEARRPIRKAMDIAMKHGLSRIPVYDREPDNIVGIVYAKDLFRALSRNGKESAVAEDVMREPYFVPHAKKVSELLREMQSNKVHMAIVVDEFGDVAGLVTLEDLIEEIVGEIADEYDVEEPNIVPLADNAWRVKARMTIDEVNDLLDTRLPNDEWDTVGGLLAGILGKLPEQGEEAALEGLVFRAEKVEGRRIATVTIVKQEEAV